MLIKCKECGCVLDSTRCDVKKEKFKFEGKQSMWLTHYDCPGCGKRVFCQIDDEVSNSFLNDLTKIMARIVRYNKRGQTPPKKLQSKYNLTSQALRSKRAELAGRYDGMWFEDENMHTWKVNLNGHNSL